MPTVINVQANVVWRASRGDDTSRWVGFCDDLGITTEAESLDELHSLIPEAMHILMLDLVEDNEFDDFLRQKGWSSTAEELGAALVHPLGFHVPWQMIAEGQNGSEREVA